MIAGAEGEPGRPAIRQTTDKCGSFLSKCWWHHWKSFFLCILYGKVEGNLVSEEQLCVLSEMYFSGIREVAELLRVRIPIAKDRVLFSTPTQDGLNHQKI